MIEHTLNLNLELQELFPEVADRTYEEDIPELCDFNDYNEPRSSLIHPQINQLQELS